jgi:hypothetical protein
VPSGIYPLPRFHPQSGSGPSRSARPSLGLRLKVWLRRDALDEQLARGVDSLAENTLLQRAEQLGSRVERIRLAGELESVLREARTPKAPFTARLSPRRAEVRACANELLALARRLRDERAIDVQGAAMASRLLFDGASPLYYQAAPVSLRDSLRGARLALDDLDDAEPALPGAA